MIALPILLSAVLGATGDETRGQSIDGLLAEEHRRSGLESVEVCGDDTFLRRVTLDLLGRIPTVDELKSFRKNPDRAAKIDVLLDDPRFSRRFADVWTASLVGYTREVESDRDVLLQWLANQLDRQASFKQIARALITAQGQAALDGPVNFVVRHQEDAGVQVTRQFLGIRLDCARCHDHPFAKWTQEDFESMTRFFEPIRIEEVAEGNLRVRSQPMRVEDSELPKFLSGAKPRTSQWRHELALFVTRSKPFARNFANRVWYDLMGRGIVHPPDDFNAENEPASPAVLEYLATDARDHDFDIRRMYRLICNSEAYQRSSKGGSAAVELKLFARRTIKPLTPEQLYDSQQLILGRQESRREFIDSFRGESFDEDFLETWKFRETMQSMLVRVTADRQFEQSPASIVDVYRLALSREPSKREKTFGTDYPSKAVLFGLMQSNEFMFNH